jgi:hypothetical protein
MTPGNAKDARKRKRTQDTQGREGQKAKKIKSEEKQNFGQSNRPTVDGQAPPATLPAEDRDIKKSKASQPKKGKDTAADQESAVNGDVRGENQEAEVKVGDDEGKLRKLERKRQKLIKKFKQFEDLPQRGIVTDDKLRSLLKKAEKLIDKHELNQDDELSRLRYRHSEARQDLWRMSSPFGGRFLDQDPLFSADEK